MFHYNDKLQHNKFNQLKGFSRDRINTRRLPEIFGSYIINNHIHVYEKHVDCHVLKYLSLDMKLLTREFSEQYTFGMIFTMAILKEGLLIDDLTFFAFGI